VTFYETITAAVRDVTDNGYDPIRVDLWMQRIDEAARRGMVSPQVLDRTLRGSLEALYKRYVERGALLQYNTGVARFTLDKVKPKLRAELDRRIMASAQLIKMNRETAIQNTLRRFAGWSTSIPQGGSETVEKNTVKGDIKKALKQLPFEDRRVLIDQGHKFTSSLSEILATDGGAIAAIWHSNWRQKNYNYRRDHKDRDGKTFAVRGNWAAQKGLMKVGPDGYVEDITKPAEEPFCRCHYQWIYNLRDLPEDMITAKGAEELQRVRKEIMR
jgi:hypothetical protein